jgi:CheY-like chemotaxis protein
VAENGIEALDALAGQSFDLVLMDIQMPGMGGIEATQAIREREFKSGRHIPIIAMTANAMQGDRERCLAAGMNGYITKPLNKSQMFATIREILHGYGMTSAVENAEAVDAHFDYAVALDSADREVLEIIGQLFVDASADYLDGVKVAIAQAQPVELVRAAHTLKGLLGNFAAKPAVQLVAKLEEIGKQADLTQAPIYLAQLEQELALFLPCLKAWLAREKFA